MAWKVTRKKKNDLRTYNKRILSGDIVAQIIKAFIEKTRWMMVGFQFRRLFTLKVDGAGTAELLSFCLEAPEHFIPVEGDVLHSGWFKGAEELVVKWTQPGEEQSPFLKGHTQQNAPWLLMDTNLCTIGILYHPAQSEEIAWLRQYFHFYGQGRENNLRGSTGMISSQTQNRPEGKDWSFQG